MPARAFTRYLLGAGLAGTLTMSLCAGVAAADLLDLLDGALDRHARDTGATRASLVPAPLPGGDAGLRARQFPLYRAAMDAPLNIPRMVTSLENRIRHAVASPALLMQQAMELRAGKAPPAVAPAVPGSDVESRLLCAADPLVPGMRMLQASSQATASAAFEAPGEVSQSWHLRLQISRVLVAIAQANRHRIAALRFLPGTITAQDLMQQVVPPAAQDRAAASSSPTYRLLLPLLDWEEFDSGMLRIAFAVQDLDRFLASTADLPVAQWRWDTPMGVVIVDTTGASSTRHVRDPLLIVDVGGDDTTYFMERSETNRISVLLDRGGNDRYVAQAPGADPGAAVLGYAVVWDSDGNDRYEGGWLAQGAALFGAALQFDGGGDDLYQAHGFAQGFALAGSAVLLDRGGNDRYSALTHAQASAGPEAIALLVDTAGDDVYELGNVPLLLRSSQLPDRNVSMGQGAGRGERQTAQGLPATAGGLGMLVDLQGNDRYTAQVFAQGAGYQQGVGLLMDGDGQDRYEVAWYGMAASAHEAVGILIDAGQGNDVYRATHSTSLAAAHDDSVAMLIDEGGDDRYTLGNLGLAAVNDHGFALFLDAEGQDSYQVLGTPCAAFGIARADGTIGSPRTAPGLFLARRTGAAECDPRHPDAAPPDKEVGRQ